MWKAILLLILIDVLWLWITKNWSTTIIRRVQLLPIQVRWIPAITVYFALAYLLGLATSGWQAFYIGLATYAVYDMTNYSIFTQYDFKFAIVDILWGGALFASVYAILQRV
jgi:uncharacterized membrane protein